MTKKVIIIDHNEGGRLSNQLWPYIGVYAYCLENKYRLDNFSFFQYAEYFDIKPMGFTSRIINIVFQVSRWLFGQKNYSDFLRRFRKFYNILAKRLANNSQTDFIEAIDIPYTRPSVIYLPPSDKPDKRFRDFDDNDHRQLLLSGWLFRNPEGIKKYRREITEYFSPRRMIWKKINHFMADLRSGGKTVIGIHIRQGDYKQKFAQGRYYFSEPEVNAILHEYIRRFDIDLTKTVFLICSDEMIDETAFSGLPIVISRWDNPVEDLFLLSRTDTIIGSDSTFGAFASYYGNIPMIVFQREGLDWEYYRDKKYYFENKYCTLVWY